MVKHFKLGEKDDTNAENPEIDAMCDDVTAAPATSASATNPWAQPVVSPAAPPVYDSDTQSQCTATPHAGDGEMKSAGESVEIDGLTVDTLGSILRQALREKARSDVLHDAVLQPRQSITDCLWQWIRGKCGLKALAVHVQAIVLKAIDAHALRDVCTTSQSRSSVTLLASLFQRLMSCSVDSLPAIAVTALHAALLSRKAQTALKLHQEAMV